MITKENIQEFVRQGHRVGREKFMLCSSGNLSWRVGNGDEQLVSGTGSWLGSIREEQVAHLKIADRTVLNGVKPSMESGFHTGVMKNRPEVNVVLHFQSKYATALAAMKEVPTNYNVIAEVPCYLGPEIPVIPYFRPGSPELSEAVVNALKDHDGVMLTSHGQVVCGKDFDDVFQKASFWELACSIMINSGMNYRTLTAEQIEDLEVYVLGKQPSAK